MATKREAMINKRFAAAETPREPSYIVTVHPIGIEAPLWTWQVDLEKGNGVLDWGQTSTRRAAVRQATRRMRLHSRRTRKEKHPWNG